jgi:hypothetical protein
MMPKNSLLVSTIPFLAAIGCPQSPAGSLGEIGTLYAEYLAALDAVRRHDCECSVEAGWFADVQECWAAYGGPTYPPILALCHAVAVDGVEVARPALECQIHRHDDFLRCLAKQGCGEQRFLCSELLWREGGCPPLPLELDLAMAQTCGGYTIPTFTCDDGTLIRSWEECNHRPECPDGSDEHEGCPPAPWQFQCDSGEVIDAWLVCDGVPHCADGSDEHEGCPPLFQCQSGDFIPMQFVCDGWPACPDGDDEEGCPTFECLSGDVIPQAWVCNGWPDCPDADDELLCDPPTVYQCASGDFIPAWWVCNGWPDCPDGDDEVDCPPRTFTCETGETILIEWVCDGEPDCPGGEDELGC